MLSMASSLEAAVEFLQTEVRPHAARIDHDVSALAQALNGLCAREWMALRRPADYGGPDWSEEDFRAFQEEVARVSGALAFLQTQHQSAVSMIAKSPHGAVKDEWLPRMADGSALMGIGFSQLRRPGTPLVTAEPVEGGYQFNGHVPWITGHSFFPHYLLAGQLADGRAVFGIAPFTEGGQARFSQPMELSAMEAAQTVTAELENLLIPTERIVDIKPPGWIMKSDLINITLQGYFAIGCARGGIDEVRAQAEMRSAESLREAANGLEAEVNACRTQMRASMAVVEEQATESRLSLRAWAIELATRCAHAAVVATGGAANLRDNPANRLLRESLVFSVSAQTGPIRDATLHRLVRRSFGTSGERVT